MCRAAIREGRPVHIIPAYEMGSPAIVLATYHYETEADAIEALTNAWENAPIVRNDTDLYDFRHEGLAYKLPVGWIDPTRR